MEQKYTGIIQAEFLEFNSLEGVVIEKGPNIHIKTAHEEMKVMSAFYKVVQVGGVIKILEKDDTEVDYTPPAPKIREEKVTRRDSRLILSEGAKAFYTKKAQELLFPLGKVALKEKIILLVEHNIPIKIIADVLDSKYQHVRSGVLSYLGGDGYDEYRELEFNDFENTYKP